MIRRNNRILNKATSFVRQKTRVVGNSLLEAGKRIPCNLRRSFNYGNVKFSQFYRGGESALKFFNYRLANEFFSEYFVKQAFVHDKSRQRMFKNFLDSINSEIIYRNAIEYIKIKAKEIAKDVGVTFGKIVMEEVFKELTKDKEQDFKKRLNISNEDFEQMVSDCQGLALVTEGREFIATLYETYQKQKAELEKTGEKYDSKTLYLAIARQILQEMDIPESQRLFLTGIVDNYESLEKGLEIYKDLRKERVSYKGRKIKQNWKTRSILIASKMVAWKIEQQLDKLKSSNLGKEAKKSIDEMRSKAKEILKIDKLSEKGVEKAENFAKFVAKNLGKIKFDSLNDEKQIRGLVANVSVQTRIIPEEITQESIQESFVEMVDEVEDFCDGMNVSEENKIRTVSGFSSVLNGLENLQQWQENKNTYNESQQQAPRLGRQVINNNSIVRANSMSVQSMLEQNMFTQSEIAKDDIEESNSVIVEIMNNLFESLPSSISSWSFDFNSRVERAREYLSKRTIHKKNYELLNTAVRAASYALRALTIKPAPGNVIATERVSGQFSFSETIRNAQAKVKFFIGLADYASDFIANMAELEENQILKAGLLIANKMNEKIFRNIVSVKEQLVYNVQEAAIKIITNFSVKDMDKDFLNLLKEEAVKILKQSFVDKDFKTVLSDAIKFRLKNEELLIKFAKKFNIKMSAETQKKIMEKAEKFINKAANYLDEQMDKKMKIMLKSLQEFDVGEYLTQASWSRIKTDMFKQLSKVGTDVRKEVEDRYKEFEKAMKDGKNKLNRLLEIDYFIADNRENFSQQCLQWFENLRDKAKIVTKNLIFCDAYNNLGLPMHRDLVTGVRQVLKNRSDLSSMLNELDFNKLSFSEMMSKVEKRVSGNNDSVFNKLNKEFTKFSQQLEKNVQQENFMVRFFKTNIIPEYLRNAIVARLEGYDLAKNIVNQIITIASGDNSIEQLENICDKLIREYTKDNEIVSKLNKVKDDIAAAVHEEVKTVDLSLENHYLMATRANELRQGEAKDDKAAKEQRTMILRNIGSRKDKHRHKRRQPQSTAGGKYK